MWQQPIACLIIVCLCVVTSSWRRLASRATVIRIRCLLIKLHAEVIPTAAVTVILYSGLLLRSPNFLQHCWNSSQQRFLRLVNLQGTNQILTEYWAKKNLGKALLTQKYKNFSLPAENFTSWASIRKFQKNMDLTQPAVQYSTGIRKQAIVMLYFQKNQEPHALNHCYMNIAYIALYFMYRALITIISFFIAIMLTVMHFTIHELLIIPEIPCYALPRINILNEPL